MGKDTWITCIRTLAGVAFAGILSGCGSAGYEGHAKIHRPVGIGIGSAKLSLMTDLTPIDRYYEKEGVIVRGSTSFKWPEALLGVVRVTSADPRQILRNEHWPGLPRLLATAINARLESEPTPEISGIQGKTSPVQLTPFACLKVDDDGGLVLFAMIQANVSDHEDGTTWRERYYAKVPGRFSIRESDASALDIYTLSRGICAAFGDAFQLFLDDIDGRLSVERPAKLKIDVPRMAGGKPAIFNALVLEEHGDSLVFSLKARLPSPFDGIYLARKADVQIVAEP